MKFNRKKIFDFKSYKCKIKVSDARKKRFMGVLILIIGIIILGGCHRKVPLQTVKSDEIEIEEPVETAIEERDEIENIEVAKALCLEIADEYKEIMTKVRQSTLEMRADQKSLSQEDIDEIEMFLVRRGYPIINSDTKYPSYLENSEGFYDFWKSVSENKEAEQKVFRITETGGLICSYFQLIEGRKYYAMISIEWDGDNEPIYSTMEYKEVIDWEMSDHDNFYYQIYSEDRSIETYSVIKLKPMDQTLYDLTEKYILPIGYQSNNMFLCDWTSEDYGSLCFNDLFEYFYKIRNHHFFYVQEQERILEPYLHADIPQWLFEETLLPYFNISLEEFRKRCLFDSVNQVYPWQEVYCGNVYYYPNVEPEVIHYEANEDGTLTLIVNARCNSYKMDCLFSHEVVIRSLENGSYQYISNQITYRGTHELPFYRPRITLQREGWSDTNIK